MNRAKTRRRWIADFVARIEYERAKLALIDAEQRLRGGGEAAGGRTGRGGRHRRGPGRGGSDRVQAGPRPNRARPREPRRCEAPSAGTASLMPNPRSGSASGGNQDFREGDRAWPGAAIVELPDLSSVHLTARLDESDRGRVQVGQPATVHLDAVPGPAYHSTVVADLAARPRGFREQLAAGARLRPRTGDGRPGRAVEAGDDGHRAHRRRPLTRTRWWCRRRPSRSSTAGRRCSSGRVWLRAARRGDARAGASRWRWPRAWSRASASRSGTRAAEGDGGSDEPEADPVGRRCAGGAGGLAAAGTALSGAGAARVAARAHRARRPGRAEARRVDHRRVRAARVVSLSAPSAGGGAAADPPGRDRHRRSAPATS